MDFIFKPPIIYENKKSKPINDLSSSWYVFPDTTLSNIAVTDCNASITGVCEFVDTLEECIDMCQSSKNEPCYSGYFIETPDKKNICVPIKRHDPTAGIKTGPFYRIRNKNHYPILKDMKTYTFTNTVYKYPPELPNAVFYTDFFVLKNIQTGDEVGMSDEGSLTDDKVLTKSNPINVQLIPAQIYRSYVENYIPVKNGDEVVINVPHTSFVLRKSDTTEEVNWKMRASTSASIPNNTFQILTKDRPIGEWLSFSDSVYFLFQNYPVIYDSEKNTLIISHDSMDTIEAKKENILFSLAPKIKAYYCDKGECKSIQLDQATTSSISPYSATYNNLTLYRSPSCWNICSNSKPSHTSQILITILIILSIALFIFIYY